MRLFMLVLALAASLFAAGWLLLGGRVMASEASGAQASSPVVLELFTSQGCSSCPPADALLQRLAREPNVLALSRPVTYWDDLGWKDTLGREENTRLQKAYQDHLEGRAGLYTPQLVVNGRWGGVGSDERGIRRAIAQQAPDKARATIMAGPAGSAVISVTDAIGAEVLLVGFAPTAEVAIGRGENSGRKIAYTNVVRAEARLGQAKQANAQFEANLAPLAAKGATRFAVLVHKGQTGPILAAALLAP